jgi:hypothetical protein
MSRKKIVFFALPGSFVSVRPVGHFYIANFIYKKTGTRGNVSPEAILEDIAFYRDLERKIAISGKGYSINSGGGSRQWTNHDLPAIRKIINELRNRYDNLTRGSGVSVGAGW